ncbi:ATP-binding cassette domain-containing protein [Acinetobacter radioresistens]|jgi:sulfonate transport system ATP-binding protein|uniref:ATP-binding cassette domain-containing protein n=1 Tax=Acinetobacter radioresistens TaxID=40216 RepID=A0A8H2JYV8_ACIRA|nr:MULTISPECIES: ATP-binding cassette domain-containing protein [Acinetobacter]AWV85066.1 ATP-binding cassette domain-containing protein [Acinetobacter radioresistens]EJO35960.1 ABC transporter, ATP-binding protein [Acinetobacter radioresistens WC-A-157]ENV89904.1 aliphatic sulfonates import ATP-binding protein SsuB [Acinetobacter radioresistens DSM 6976 = NBRC 102413 = CIP 103788]EXB32946.1 ABC transporter family protein [Acinetobacter sp. 1461402]EXB72377.1 ABC transporter family protein [Ac
MSNLNIPLSVDIEAKPSTNFTTQPQNGAEIVVEQLHKFYGQVKVLEELDLHIQAGEFVAIVGRSGCGKSTLLRLIAGLEAASYGEIKFKSAQNFREGITTDDIRVMFQDSRLLPWKTVEKNVQLGLAHNRHAHAVALLKKVGLAEKASNWPAQLSGGQRQRAALARALSHTPRVLLLDEPLGALDALTRLEMQNLIEQLWREQGFTAVLVTHDVAEAVQLADRIILLDKGQIAHHFKIDLPRPRKKSVQFTELEQQVLDAVLAT